MPKGPSEHKPVGVCQGADKIERGLAPNAGLPTPIVAGAAGFESEAENTETREKAAGSGSELVVETPTGDHSRGPEADLALPLGLPPRPSDHPVRQRAPHAGCHERQDDPEFEHLE